MKRIYISGPISGHDYDKRKEAFHETKVMLQAQGFEVFNPMENGLPPDSTTNRHMHRDLAALTSEDKPMDAIYMMTGWLHSAGCKLEFDVATAIGLTVYMEDRDGQGFSIMKFK